MKSKSQYISAVLATLFGVALISCSSHSDAPTDASKMSISFRVETRNGGQEGDDENGGEQAGYEQATEWENYIDIDNEDYCIAFFDNDNRCITPFMPSSVKAVDGKGYVEYTLEGQVPGILTFYSNFKIVVLANWGVNNYPEIKTGTTTIGNLCCPQKDRMGQFEYFSNSNYQIGENQRYVPMYGVKEYKGVVFGRDNEDNPTVLYQGNFGPVNMLRAIAKVELIFDTEDNIMLDPNNEIYITNYNAYGYCAPEGAYVEKDYYNNNWNNDYWHGHLHPVGGRNDQGEEKHLNMTKLVRDGKEVWVAYLPEYRNVDLTTGATDCEHTSAAATVGIKINKARIAVPHIQGGSEKTSYLDFATYTGGEPTNPINIERNNLYRFTVTRVDQGVKWKVEALPWNGYEHEEIVM